jgi:7,8-dihydro-6-hydroxymethylpterin-pyrophosphokinase
LGSNIGDRLDNLHRLRALSKVAIYKSKRSRALRNESVKAVAGRFFNALRACKPSMSPMQLLHAFVTLNTRWEDRNLHGTAASD